MCYPSRLNPIKNNHAYQNKLSTCFPHVSLISSNTQITTKITPHNLHKESSHATVDEHCFTQKHLLDLLTYTRLKTEAQKPGIRHITCPQCISQICNINYSTQMNRQSKNCTLFQMTCSSHQTSRDLNQSSGMNEL